MKSYRNKYNALVEEKKEMKKQIKTVKHSLDFENYVKKKIRTYKPVFTEAWGHILTNLSQLKDMVDSPIISYITTFWEKVSHYYHEFINYTKNYLGPIRIRLIFS